MLLALAGGLLLSGCQTPAVAGTAASGLQTFDSLYLASLKAETLALQETTIALNTHAIGVPAAKQVMAVLDSVKLALDAAHTLALAGNTGLATADLTAAVAQLSTIGVCLTQKPLTPQTFTACTTSLTPVAVRT